MVYLLKIMEEFQLLIGAVGRQTGKFKNASQLGHIVL